MPNRMACYPHSMLFGIHQKSWVLADMTIATFIAEKAGFGTPALPVLPLRFVGQVQPDLRLSLVNLKFTQRVSYQEMTPSAVMHTISSDTTAVFPNILASFSRRGLESVLLMYMTRASLVNEN